MKRALAIVAALTFALLASSALYRSLVPEENEPRVPQSGDELLETVPVRVKAP